MDTCNLPSNLCCRSLRQLCLCPLSWTRGTYQQTSVLVLWAILSWFPKLDTCNLWNLPSNLCARSLRRVPSLLSVSLTARSNSCRLWALRLCSISSVQHVSPCGHTRRCSPATDTTALNGENCIYDKGRKESKVPNCGAYITNEDISRWIFNCPYTSGGKNVKVIPYP
jgi:hypothetical protein